jgi:hypothetical protein
MRKKLFFRTPKIDRFKKRGLTNSISVLLPLKGHNTMGGNAMEDF